MGNAATDKFWLIKNCHIQYQTNMKRICKLYASWILLVAPGMITAQSGDLKLLDWRPESQLVVKEKKY
jgi:hypothetical protein